MGYTHYFEHREVSQTVWNKIVGDCMEVCLGSDVRIKDDLDGSDPKFAPKFIAFNGVGDDGHETFNLNKQGSGGFTFCKTAAKPYDLLVCACLLVYKHHSPGTIDLSSDGDEDDWSEARDLVREVLEY